MTLSLLFDPPSDASVFGFSILQRNIESISSANVVAFLLLFYGFLAWSIPILATELGGFNLSIALGVFLCVLILRNPKIHSLYFFICILLLIPWIIFLIHWGLFAFQLVPIYAITALLLISQSTQESLRTCTSWATKLVFGLVIGAWVALLYKVLGFSPIAEVKLLGRPLYVYMTSLSLSYPGLLIRPSGIYDEPGAFSFVICALVYFRDTLGMERKKTVYLLCGGLVTLSMAHVVFSVCYILHILISEKRVSKGFLLAISVFLVAFSVTWIISPDVLIGRFLVTEVGTVAGDNRTVLMMSALEILKANEDAIFWGIGPISSIDSALLTSKYGAFSTNPLSPLIGGGLVGAFGYYSFLVFGFLYGLLSRKNFLFFAFTLLLLQRPYVMQFGYSVLVAIALALALRKHKCP